VYATIAATYEYAIASIMLGDQASALRVLNDQRLRVPATASVSLQQTWMLLAADIYEMLGQHERATQRSVDALALGSGTVLARRTSGGAAARAATRLLRTSGREGAPAAIQLLQRLLADGHLMDATEHAEVLDCCVNGGVLLEDIAKYRAELDRLIEILPINANRRLELLRVSSPYNPDTTT
jgi:hypothetical protein